MRNAIAVFLVAVLFLTSCAKNSAEEKTVHDELQGEWKVVSVNCPEILGERNGERKKFPFRVPAGKYANIKRTDWLAECNKVTPGWEIHVVSQSRYSFFPPTTKTK